MVVRSHTLLHHSQALKDVIAEAEYVARSDSKVLITGESGVGKELLARFVHEHSPRSRRPLITINCAGVPESLLESELFGHVRGSFTDAYKDRRGLMEVADGGTVFLDEVGEMSLRMQALLLRFLETGEIQRVGSDHYKTTVDVRVISATNRDLLEQTRQREFREDLYYRLNVVHLVIPPLRSHREDIRPLFEYYLDVMAEQHRAPACQVAEDAWLFLEAAPWRGNVRELRNVAERVALRFAGRLVTMADVRSQMEGGVVTAAMAASRAEEAEALTRSYVDPLAKSYFDRMLLGQETFWTALYQPLMLRDVTRETVRAVVRMALTEARGNYRTVLQMFNLPPTDYKRFLSFLQKYECHVPFQAFRAVPPAQDSAALRRPDAIKAAV